VAFKICQNPFPAGAVPQTPLEELTTLPRRLVGWGGKAGEGTSSPYIYIYPTLLGTDPPLVLAMRPQHSSQIYAYGYVKPVLVGCVLKGSEALSVDTGRACSRGLEVTDAGRLNGGSVCAGLCEAGVGVKAPVVGDLDSQQAGHRDHIDGDLGASSAIDLTMYATAQTAHSTVRLLLLPLLQLLFSEIWENFSRNLALISEICPISQR